MKIIIQISITIVAALVLSSLARFLLKAVFANVKNSTKSVLYGARIETLEGMVKNMLSVVIFTAAFLMVLTYVGVNIAPILTGAGIVGLAVSFGAQTLIKDLIAGFFIILENQFNVGDTIIVDGYEGVVQKITFRITVLRDKNNLMYIPNSMMQKVVVRKR